VSHDILLFSLKMHYFSKTMELATARWESQCMQLIYSLCILSPDWAWNIQSAVWFYNNFSNLKIMYRLVERWVCWVLWLDHLLCMWWVISSKCLITVSCASKSSINVRGRAAIALVNILLFWVHPHDIRIYTHTPHKKQKAGPGQWKVQSSYENNSWWIFCKSGYTIEQANCMFPKHTIGSGVLCLRVLPDSWKWIISSLARTSFLTVLSHINFMVILCGMKYLSY